jgi:hypothetical protein
MSALGMARANGLRFGEQYGANTSHPSIRRVLRAAAELYPSKMLMVVPKPFRPQMA